MLSPRIRIRNTTSLKNYGNVYSKIKKSKNPEKTLLCKESYWWPRLWFWDYFAVQVFRKLKQDSFISFYNTLNLSESPRKQAQDTRRHAHQTEAQGWLWPSSSSSSSSSPCRRSRPRRLSRDWRWWRRFGARRGGRKVCPRELQCAQVSFQPGCTVTGRPLGGKGPAGQRIRIRTDPYPVPQLK